MKADSKLETLKPEQIKKMQKGNVKFNNIILFNSSKLAFIGMPKAANTSIKHWLLPLIGKENRTFSDMQEVHDKASIGFSYCNNKILYENRDKYFIFSTVRNPWSRLWSTYQDKVSINELHPPLKKLGFENSMSFKEFVYHCCIIPDSEADIHFRSQFTMVMWKGTLLPNLILKMENLENFAPVLESIITTSSKVQLGELPWVNKKTNNNYKNFYDNELKELVSLRYEKDIRLFGYEF